MDVEKLVTVEEHRQNVESSRLGNTESKQFGGASLKRVARYRAKVRLESKGIAKVPLK